MRILEKHPIDTSPLRELAALSGIEIPDPLIPIREADLDVDKILSDISEFRGIADELEGLADELSIAQHRLRPGAGAWDSEAAAAAAGLGEQLLGILRWMLAIVLIIIAVVLLVVVTVLYVILGLLKLIHASVEYATAVIGIAAGIRYLGKGGAFGEFLQVVARRVGGRLFGIAGAIALLAGVLAPGVEALIHGLRSLLWQLLLWAGQVVGKPEAENVARRERDSALDDLRNAFP